MKINSSHDHSANMGVTLRPANIRCKRILKSRPGHSIGVLRLRLQKQLASSRAAQFGLLLIPFSPLESKSTATRHGAKTILERKGGTTAKAAKRSFSGTELTQVQPLTLETKVFPTSF